ncbi:MAG TPA: hypothetical protein VGG39_21775 [Polyangiaceae bacterium]|jgi:hypothetical protein
MGRRLRRRAGAALGAIGAVAASVVATPAAAQTAGDDAAQLPYATPRETLVPGTPGMPGGFHFMLNGFGQLQNTGLPAYRIANANVKSFSGGATYPLLTDDWAMGYARDAHGWVEALLMLDFEPATVGGAGYPEIGQSGEGLWDAQHAHQFLHQAVVAFHPLAGTDGWHPTSMVQEGRYDLSLFGGQGSATIGPPIFMHRASSPGPTVPRKHHKGENPHETFPVLGAALRIDSTWLEWSVFSAKELTPQDSRWYPHVAPPQSFAARVRHTFGGWIEVQTSGERLVNQGHGEPDAYQGSASAYAWGAVDGWRLDGLLDWAIDVPDRDAQGNQLTSQGALFELATRNPDRRTILWHRSELDQREESPAFGGGVSSPWVFETLGFERVVVGGRTSGLQVGVFGEATYIDIPASVRAFYGTESAVTVNVGLHLFGMWMFDGDLRPMHHGAM